jgi:hypothetical protein
VPVAVSAARLARNAAATAGNHSGPADTVTAHPATVDPPRQSDRPRTAGTRWPNHTFDRCADEVIDQPQHRRGRGVSPTTGEQLGPVLHDPRDLAAQARPLAHRSQRRPGRLDGDLWVEPHQNAEQDRHGIVVRFTPQAPCASVAVPGAHRTVVAADRARLSPRPATAAVPVLAPALLGAQMLAARRADRWRDGARPCCPKRDEQVTHDAGRRRLPTDQHGLPVDQRLRQPAAFGAPASHRGDDTLDHSPLQQRLDTGNSVDHDTDRVGDHLRHLTAHRLVTGLDDPRPPRPQIADTSLLAGRCPLHTSGRGRRDGLDQVLHRAAQNVQ